MNNKDTFDILHSEFDENIQLPDSLSKRNVVAKLNNVSQEKQSTISFKKLASLAAAMIVVMVCAIVATTDWREDQSVEIQDIANSTTPITQSAIVAPTLNNQTLPEGETALLKANSRDDIVDRFKNLYKDNNNRYNYLFGYGADMDGYKGVADVTMAAPESSGAVNESYNNAASGSAIDHAETNTQTQGVDEGDIIKTDSRYIYFVGSDGSGNKKLKIIDTLTMTAVYNSYLYDENGDIIWVSDMYLKDNILVAVCAKKNEYNYRSMAYGYYGATGSTVIATYDITDRAEPELIRRETQDGSYRSSRLIGNTLYTVSQYYVRAESEETIENVCIPKVSGAEIACDCIYLPENMGESYICLTALDISDNDGSISAVAVLGSTENYYCSQDTFYILAENYYNSSEYKTKDSNSYTVINSFSLDGLNISYKATGEVKGSTSRSQYSLDEYENNLRVATTYYNYNTQKNESSLYVLDENLDVIGKIEDIANNEQIKSVRYMGKKAYVVTFRNTDPLFAIDLSDPKNPTVLGELKLPGYLIKETLDAKGIEYVETTDLSAVMPDLDILYMTRVQRERFFNEEDYLRLKDSYILTPEKLLNAKEDLAILHPLPRVNEIHTSVDADPRACYFRQVLNGKFIRMALILKLLSEAGKI